MLATVDPLLNRIQSDIDCDKLAVAAWTAEETLGAVLPGVNADGPPTVSSARGIVAGRLARPSPSPFGSDTLVLDAPAPVGVLQFVLDALAGARGVGRGIAVPVAREVEIKLSGCPLHALVRASEQPACPPEEGANTPRSVAFAQ